MKYFSLDIMLIAIFMLQYGNGTQIKIMSSVSTKVQQSAVRRLIRRVVGSKSNQFFGKIDATMEFRSFQIKTVDNVLIIRGFDAISVAKGFHHYLKYYLNRDISWLQTKVTSIPDILPVVNVTSTTNSRFIFYQNVCAWSYSYVWWTWSNWRIHIDWMCMMGVTFTIAPIQEQIWHNIYEKLGLTDDEISNYLSGPAFLSWQRMGNMYGWGGPISPFYRKTQLILQKQIIKAQRNLGMLVAVPAFAGHVPPAFERLYPNATFTKVDRWNQFPNKFCCTLFVEPSSDLFLKIASLFLRATIKSYGSDHIYFCDPFNEIQPRLADESYLSNTAFHIYESMTSVDKSAIWLLQGWMFVENVFWTKNLIQAFVTSIPLGKVIILDLQSEQFPQYKRTESYFGQPFIWCMLHNFGGTLGMHGSAYIINTAIRLAENINNSTMIGVGITPEGINQNYGIYSLVLERAWVKEDLNIGKWFSVYSNARYGTKDENIEKAWMYLHKSVYSFHGTAKLRGKYVITQRPSINLSPWLWYNTSSIILALQHLLDANVANITSKKIYENDLVDTTRQLLQTLADKFYTTLIDAYRKSEVDKFKFISVALLNIFVDLESILKTNENFLFGSWISSAKKMGRTPTERRLYEINSRNQVTTWGPNVNIPDYASKQWSGVVNCYFLPRWKLFITSLTESLSKNTPFNESSFKKKVINVVEIPFTFGYSNFSYKPIGDSFQISYKVFKKWSSFLNHRAVITFFT